MLLLVCVGKAIFTSQQSERYCHHLKSNALMVFLSVINEKNGIGS